MTEEIVREIETSTPEYIDIDSMRDEKEMHRTLNLINDGINQKKMKFYEMMVTTGAQRIPNLPVFGAFVICVQGEVPGVESSVWACASDGSSAAVNRLVTDGGAPAITVVNNGANFDISKAAGDAAKYYLTILGYF